jgi:hypothetical protein
VLVKGSRAVGLERLVGLLLTTDASGVEERVW